jgi:hypothetical protein
MLTFCPLIYSYKYDYLVSNTTANVRVAFVAVLKEVELKKPIVSNVGTGGIIPPQGLLHIK